MVWVVAMDRKITKGPDNLFLTSLSVSKNVSSHFEARVKQSKGGLQRAQTPAYFETLKLKEDAFNRATDEAKAEWTKLLSYQKSSGHLYT